MSSSWWLTGEGPLYVHYPWVSSLAWVAWVVSWHSVRVPTELYLDLAGLSGLWVGLAIASVPLHLWYLLIDEFTHWFHICPFEVSGPPQLPVLWHSLQELRCYLQSHGAPQKMIFPPSPGDVGNVCRHFWSSQPGGVGCILESSGYRPTMLLNIL